MEGCTLAAKQSQPKLDPNQPPPRTEQEWRDRQGIVSTKALATSDEQIALLRSDELIDHIDFLNAQYTRLVHQKNHRLADAQKQAAGEAAPKTESIDDGPLSQSDLQESPSHATPAAEGWPLVEGWPDVEKLDWNGFCNWVQRCKEHDTNLKSKLDARAAEREAVKAEIFEKLSNWEPPADFDYGYAHQDPRKFYDGEPLWKIDARRMGWSTDSEGEED